jgi:PAS domain S-box-containing protein
VELSSTPTLCANPDGAIVLVNRELARQFGYAREELVGQHVDLLLPEAAWPLDADFPQMADAPIVTAGRELVGRRKDGSPISVEIDLRPIHTKDRVFVLASIVDISERSRLEDAVRAALEEQLEFERFVAELSFQFINLSADQISDAIRAGLGRICQQLGLDRGSFVRVGQDGVIVEPITWTAAGVPPVNGPQAARELFPWAFERVLAGEVLAFSTIDEIPEESDRSSYRAVGTKSAVVVPLSVDARVVGAVGFHMVRCERQWPADVKHRLTVIGSVFAQVLARQQREEALRESFQEAQRLRDQLQVENVYLRQEERERLRSTRVVGQSAAIRRVLDQVQQVAATDATVLLRGETGTGKELFASCIHELGTRRTRTMVRVNCAAIPATLIESELFGREKGAFTGALARQVGRFELANHSTIFLDEIGDLPLDVQVKLLRVLEERTIERLGNPRPIAVDARIIAATHRDLEQRTAEGAFREDLYYRLNVFPIFVPPLRERVEDIPLLVWRFVDEFSHAFGKRIDFIEADTMAALQEYTWPGNIRELRNVVERAMIVATGRRLTVTLPTAAASPPVERSPKLIDVEKEHIRSVLETTGWRIRGSGGAAERLGLKPTTLETRIAKLGLKRPGHS